MLHEFHRGLNLKAGLIIAIIYGPAFSKSVLSSFVNYLFFCNEANRPSGCYTNNLARLHNNLLHQLLSFRFQYILRLFPVNHICC
jgi:hypothetical protein